jgi:NAD+ synthase (glutamine-hydrolysing)
METRAMPEERGSTVSGLRLMVAQINVTVGDVAGNAARIIECLGEARRQRVDLAVFPELAVCGYPPEDLLLRPSFLSASEAALAEIAEHTRGLTAVVGYAQRDGDLYNAAAVLHDGRLAGVHRKAFLPNYSVFDEERYFRRGIASPLFDSGELRFGVSICEDIWYPSGPYDLQARAGAELLVNLSASPYQRGKVHSRERMLATRADDAVSILVFCNLVGGQDELVFDGNSLVLAPDGTVLARGASFAEDVLVVDVDPESVFRGRLVDPRGRKDPLTPDELARVPVVQLSAIATVATPRPALPAPDAGSQPLSGPAEVYAALVLGTRDYIRKNGFETVVLGLSGGIDSALTGAIAVDAVGPEHVVGVAMPSPYSSPTSLQDAQALAANLGLRLLEIPIDAVLQSYLDTLTPLFEGRPADVTEENIQPRIRGNYLMALSNKFGWLVLTTGNKSEVSVGYSTLYGDTAGGFAPLKDVPKQMVYALARWRNEQAGERPWIPEHSITRVPSAELKPGQTDQDSLPPYDVLDPILEAYVEQEMSAGAIAALGFERATVDRVLRMVDRAEHKRRQSPPGVKISARAFGRDRRMPITVRTPTPTPGSQGSPPPPPEGPGERMLEHSADEVVGR